MKIEDLNFDEPTMEVIEIAEGHFDEYAKENGITLSMIEWIEDSLQEPIVEKAFQNLSDREKFLYTLGAMSGLIYGDILNKSNNSLTQQ